MENGGMIPRKLFARRLIAVTVFSLLLILAVICGYLLFRLNKTHKSHDPPTVLPVQQPGGLEDRSWCILKQGMLDETIQNNINYACGYIINCNIIKKGGNCYLPKDEHNYASVVMNMYYQDRGANTWDCDFNGSGVIVYDDPSFGSCVFPGQRG